MKGHKVTYLSDLYFDLSQWKAGLDFWKEEIKFFDRHLAKIVRKAADRKLLNRARHFQLVFSRQHEDINGFADRLQRHESALMQIGQGHPSEIDPKHFREHAGLQEELDLQRNTLRKLKEEFFLFLTETVPA